MNAVYAGMLYLPIIAPSFRLKHVGEYRDICVSARQEVADPCFRCIQCETRPSSH